MRIVLNSEKDEIIKNTIKNIKVEDFKKGLNEQFFNRIYGQMITDKLLAFLTENNKLVQYKKVNFTKY